MYDELIDKLFKRKCIHVHKNRENTRRFTYKNLANYLCEQFGTNAYNKRVPEWIKQSPKDLKLAFIQGYLDTDGSVFYDNGKVKCNFTSVNLELLEDIQDILFSLKIRNSIVLHQKQNKNKFGGISKQSYRINVCRQDNLFLAINPQYRSRKIKVLELSKTTGIAKNKIKFVDNKILIKIEKIESSLYSGYVYNFECGTHTFMCRNILTHNCDPLIISGV